MDTGLMHQGLVGLRRGEVLRLRDAAGRHLGVVGGAVWVTQDGDRRDWVIEAGHSFRFDRDGLALVVPVNGGASIVLEDGLAPAPQAARPAGRAAARDWPVHSMAFEREARRMRAEAVAQILRRLTGWLKSRWQEAAGSLGAALRTARTRAQLHALSDHLLRDIGLRREQIDCVARQLPC